MYIQLCTFT